MRTWLVRSAIVVAVIVVTLALKLTLFAADPVEVEVAVISTGPVEETVTNSRAGTVKATRRAKLSPEFGGQVVELPFREGDRVRKGEILLRLEDSLQRARLELSRRESEASDAERDRACFSAERAGRELERVRRLADQQIVSDDLLDEIESAKLAADAACKAAGATAARAKSSVTLARTELEKTILRAPFDGVLAEVTTEVGEWTTPSPPAMPVPPVIDLLDPGSVYVSAPMDEVDSALIETGQPTRVTVDSHRDRTFAGRVRRVAPYVLDLEAQNRTVEIEVEFQDPELASELLPGTSADVEIILETREDVLRLPTAALMEGNRVLLLAASKLEARQVEIGLRNWDYTEIVSGLKAGDRVVSSLDRPEIKAGVEAVAADG